MQQTTIIGIAGGTGSGKTTLAKKLKTAFSDEDVIILCHDYYYHAHDELSYEERTRLDYDHPDAFETTLLIDHLKKLRQGKTIYRPVYSFSDYNRTGDVVEVKPARVIILEGIMIFEDRALRELMDMKVFVDTDADVRILRRLVRDVKERGRSLDSVVRQYLETVKPMHEQFVEPSKKHADIIIPRGGHNQVALNMLINRVRSLLDE
ncbi:uridine kinase [Neobittarella massiliensis]|uniref:uridine kinase n=1 Tax=Neobittarella massiliensis (ex Bilen et al. 2018) TaxID=2041842 RepID=UPI000CF64FE3|nr:uridine kinase [Neobittarella massiliensis]